MPLPAPVPIRSRLLDTHGIAHGFSTRAGGVSGGMFASLNFGNLGALEPAQRDPAGNIAANFARFIAATEPDRAQPRAVRQVHQVHGAACAVASESSQTGPDPHADALVVTNAAQFAAVRTADCAPVLVADAHGRAVAAVHAGWQGCLLNVSAAAVRSLRIALAQQIGLVQAETCTLIAAIGPRISQAALEIGPEVAHRFADAGYGHAIIGGRGDRSHLCMAAVILAQLAREGITEVDVIDACTFAQGEQFFSHRRCAGQTGRMVALIGPRGSK